VPDAPPFDGIDARSEEVCLVFPAERQAETDAMPRASVADAPPVWFDCAEADRPWEVLASLAAR
jgi:hypothetical protein